MKIIEALRRATLEAIKTPTINEMDERPHWKVAVQNDDQSWRYELVTSDPEDALMMANHLRESGATVRIYRPMRPRMWTWLDTWRTIDDLKPKPPLWPKKVKS